LFQKIPIPSLWRIIGNSMTGELGGGGCTKFVNFKVKCEPKIEFSEVRRGTKSLHKGGGSIHIFWNNSLKDS